MRVKHALAPTHGSCFARAPGRGATPASRTLRSVRDERGRAAARAGDPDGGREPEPVGRAVCVARVVGTAMVASDVGADA